MACVCDKVTNVRVANAKCGLTAGRRSLAGLLQQTR